MTPTKLEEVAPKRKNAKTDGAKSRNNTSEIKTELDNNRDDKGDAMPKRKNNISVSQGAKGQQDAAVDLFNAFLRSTNQSWQHVKATWKLMKVAENTGEERPKPDIYDVLEEFAKFLYNYDTAKARNANRCFSSQTADNYLSQAKTTLMQHLGPLDQTRCSAIRNSMKKIFVEREILILSPPSPLVFSIIKMKDLSPEVDGTQAYSQLDAKLRGVTDDADEEGTEEASGDTTAIHEKVRKRPSIAQHINAELKKLQAKFDANFDNATHRGLEDRHLTPGMA
ncbi:hypothetical protein SPRG_12551 [Saprolegnia parasitica CBS 223.65]|uniref:Uncharacterized protein n=1 Tax=Saprolegnia parasitica (strain CBS 223.65) TaxID=695850 RepID=A0A067C7P3_SAPPC|nr:hypothetical protein SPRG_12551 [Saprolegnia parasitica CBS 223.65]KDO22571.1 hypothetical protein SPRG_12551 [Saprolegnia parasitica CBS 223.65]|eukprot:XP_012206687.1 hypothetical protein SPRG_12551 [Saprolegnia parasitica CBS 223.65]